MRGLQEVDCRKWVAGRRLQEEGSKKRVARRKLQEENCRERVAGRGWSTYLRRRPPRISRTCALILLYFRTIYTEQ